MGYRDLGFWLYIFVWLPYTLLAICYGLGSPWWRSPIGRAFWLSKAALSLILTLVMSVLIFGRYSWFEEIRAALLAVVAIAAWYQLSVVLCIQRDARNAPEHPRRRSTDL